MVLWVLVAPLLAAGAPVRLPRRGRARSLPRDCTARMGAPPRRRSSTPPTRTTRTTRMHERLHAADARHRALARARPAPYTATTFTRSAPRHPRTRGRGNGHVGCRTPCVRGTRTRARPDPVQPPTSGALTPSTCITPNRGGRDELRCWAMDSRIWSAFGRDEGLLRSTPPRARQHPRARLRAWRSTS
jgi:hypothetical protein